MSNFNYLCAKLRSFLLRVKQTDSENLVFEELMLALFQETSTMNWPTDMVVDTLIIVPDLSNYHA